MRSRLFGQPILWAISNSMADLYHAIYDGEIFQKSRCIWHENILMDYFRSTLTALGYSSVDPSNKVWQRGNKKVVVCLVDDFSTCSTEYSTKIPYLFDRGTTVITDNHVNCPTQYQVIQLPTSFFGIYNHVPTVPDWAPKRRFNFAVNRLDAKRMLMFLELHSLQAKHAVSPNIDYVNFNCWAWDGDNTSKQGLQDSFAKQFGLLDEAHQEQYRATFQLMLSKMPYRNHDLSMEQSHLGAWVNLVMETYSSDTTIALSEKMFRALCLPVPWAIYSGKYTVAYLKSLGFDILDDLVDHRYDSIIENHTAAYGDKMIEYIFEADRAATEMQAKPFTEVKARCEQAAQHNQKLLAEMQQQWPVDFATWLPNVIEQIK